MDKIFRIDLAGYSSTLPSLAAISAYVADLKATSPGIVGQVATITQGHVYRGVNVFPAGSPRKRLTVSA